MATAPIARALRALDGLSVGDAFGEKFFAPGVDPQSVALMRTLPPGPWEYTSIASSVTNEEETVVSSIYSASRKLTTITHRVGYSNKQALSKTVVMEFALRNSGGKVFLLLGISGVR
jgi:hypothetical protein